MMSAYFGQPPRAAAAVSDLWVNLGLLWLDFDVTFSVVNESVSDDVERQRLRQILILFEAGVVPICFN